MEITIECTVDEHGNVMCLEADFGVIAVTEETPIALTDPFRPWDAHPDLWSMLPLLLLAYWLWKRRIREGYTDHPNIYKLGNSPDRYLAG